jgi:hypothetical protein
MSPSKRQKSKGGKRPRAWHRGPLEDQRFEQAITALDAARTSTTEGTCPPMDTHEGKTHTQKAESDE